MDGGINNFGENCLMKLVTLEKLCIDLSNNQITSIGMEQFSKNAFIKLNNLKELILYLGNNQKIGEKGTE